MPIDPRDIHYQLKLLLYKQKQLLCQPQEHFSNCHIIFR